MRFLRAFLAAFSRPLSVRPSESGLEGEDEQVRRGLPANLAAIAINGFWLLQPDCVLRGGVRRRDVHAPGIASFSEMT
jgi:hypothetical protein